MNAEEAHTVYGWEGVTNKTAPNTKAATKTINNSKYRFFIDNKETRPDTIAKNNKKIFAKNRMSVAFSSLLELSANRLITLSIVSFFFLDTIPIPKYISPQTIKTLSTISNQYRV